MEVKTVTIFVVIIGLVFTGCGQGKSVEPTMASVQVSTPAMTPELTKTSVPTASPTPASYMPDPEAVKLLEEAFSYSRLGEDEKAIETYTKAIEADPLFGQPYFNRGAIYADHREIEKALTDFNKGLELDPSNPHGYSLRANAHIELDKLDEALEDIKSLLSLTKDDEYIKMAFTSAGHIYLNQDKPYIALAAYTEALQIDEFFSPALISRGQIYSKQGDWLRAFADLVLALSLEEDPEIRQAIKNILVEVYPEGTSSEEAMKASEPYFYEAMEYQKNGDYKNCSDSLSRAIEIDPLQNEYYYQRGWNYTNFEDIDFKKAETDMSYVIALNPFSPAGYYSRGLFKVAQGLVTESIADLEKALEFDFEPDAMAKTNQLLKDMRQRLKTCQMTEFEVVNNAETPTFKFTFIGPPNTDFAAGIFNNVTGDGYTMEAKTPQDGITLTEIEYELSKDEITPIELEIWVWVGDKCSLRRTIIWPEIDILAELYGENP